MKYSYAWSLLVIFISILGSGMHIVSMREMCVGIIKQHAQSKLGYGIALHISKSETLLKDKCKEKYALSMTLILYTLFFVLASKKM